MSFAIEFQVKQLQISAKLSTGSQPSRNGASIAED